MSFKARWITGAAVWAVVLVGATIAARYLESSPRTFVECTLYVSLAVGFLGFLYFAGGAAGDAFPPHTVVDSNASQNERGQPLDHGRGSLPKLSLGVVVMVAAGIPALASLTLLYFLSR